MLCLSTRSLALRSGGLWSPTTKWPVRWQQCQYCHNSRQWPPTAASTKLVVDVLLCWAALHAHSSKMWSVLTSVPWSVCLSVIVRERLNQSRCHLGVWSVDSGGPKEPCGGPVLPPAIRKGIKKFRECPTWAKVILGCSTLMCFHPSSGWSQRHYVFMLSVCVCVHACVPG